MIHLRSPFDRSVAGVYYWARLIDKIRLHHVGELPDDYCGVLGHKLGTDGQFLGHFGVTFEQVTEVVLTKDDTALSAWLEGAVEDFLAKKEAWNELAPELGKEGTVMARAFKFAVRKYFRDDQPPLDIDTIFGLIDFDERRSS